MTPRQFDKLSAKDFQNGAVRDEIRSSLADGIDFEDGYNKVFDLAIRLALQLHAEVERIENLLPDTIPCMLSETRRVLAEADEFFGPEE